MQVRKAIETAILALVGRDPTKSVCPSEAARAVEPGPDFHRLMPMVRAAAVDLALAGRIVILRKGKVQDPAAFKGVYRLKAAQGAGQTPVERPVQA
jgi:hypothetical protein